MILSMQIMDRIWNISEFCRLFSWILIIIMIDNIETIWRIWQIKKAVERNI